LIVLSSITFYLTNCQKQQEGLNKQTNDQITIDEKSQAMTSHVLAFKTKMEYYRNNPDLKSGGELYTADSAVLELESLLNYNFCYTGIECNKKTFEIAEITMPLDEIERINDPNLMLVYYDKVIDTIQAQMGRVDYENMKLLLVDLEQTGTDSNGDAIVSVGALIGNEGIRSLEEGVWFYGENMGLCGSGNYAPEDAASQLELRVINNVLPEPPQGGSWRYSNVVNTYIIPTQDPLTNNPDNYLDYKIFYATEAVAPITDTEKCLPMVEMSFYMNHYIDYALNYETTTNKDFKDCIIEGNPYWVPVYHIQHDYWIYVGHRYLIMEIPVINILTYID